MKIENEPGAYGFLAGLVVFLVGLTAYTTSCAHYPTPIAHVEPARTPMQQQDATVSISTECGRGSGVLLDGTHVLTAFHVINCGKPGTVKIAKQIVVVTHDGHEYAVHETTGEPTKDAARLDLLSPVPGIVPVAIRHAQSHETVCARVAVPHRGVRCGQVEQLGISRAYGDVKVAEVDLWFGNSGGGVYADGALVGLVTRLSWCDAWDAAMWEEVRIAPDHTCGGYITSLDDTSVLP